MTYDLRAEYLAAGYGEIETAEFDRPDTIEAIEQALRELGHETDRIGNCRRLVERLAAGERWELVFNIAEGLRGIGREAQVPSLLDLYEIPYTFSDPLVMALTLHKGMTKRVIASAGIPTAPFALVESSADARQVELPYPLFAKPVAEGTGKGVTPASRIENRAALHGVCDALLERFAQPVLVETYLPGREFTVGILGTGGSARVLGTMEVVLLPDAEPEVYSYANKERSEELVRYELRNARRDPEVAKSEQRALAAWRLLGCRDGGRVDLRSDARGEPSFLEANPLAGLHPRHSDLPILANLLEFPYRRLIESIVESAKERTGAPRGPIAAPVA